MRSLRAALGFLSIVPVGHVALSPEDPLGRRWFPLVGLLLGVPAAALGWLVATVSSPLLGAVAAVAILAVLSGGLHVDGLADCADGMLGGATRERRLAIMRDSRVGSFGVAAVALVIAGDIAALASAGGPLRLAIAVVAAAALARLAMLAVVMALPYARPAGLGAMAGRGRPVLDVAVAVPCAALPLVLDWRHGLLAAGLVLAATAGLAALARTRIGGATGDVYGAAVEVGQLAALTAFAVRL